MNFLKLDELWLQWQSFNNGNWKNLESSVRKFADSREKPVVVFTGGFEQLQLENDDGQLVPIALGNNQIPVPSESLFL